MSTPTTIRIDDGVKEEATRIADQLGMSLNMVVNILLHKFNNDKGFAYPIQLPSAPKSVFDMTSGEIEAACKKAVVEREVNSTAEYALRFDKESGQMIKKYADGRIEYVIV